MEYKYYGIDKRFFNKICTVLKYMSLESPLARAGFLKDNYFSCKNAFNLLNTLLTQTEWITRENENETWDSELQLMSEIKTKFDIAIKMIESGDAEQIIIDEENK